MKENSTLYLQGHLVAAVIRLHTYREGAPPTPEQIARQLSITTEQAHYLINKMEELGAVRVAEGSFGVRVMLDDHLQLEELEGKEFTPNIEEELAAFQESQAKKSAELSKMFEKDYVDDDKEKLKEDLDAKIADPAKLKKADNPLDAMFKKKS